MLTAKISKLKEGAERKECEAELERLRNEMTTVDSLLSFMRNYTEQLNLLGSVLRSSAITPQYGEGNPSSRSVIIVNANNPNKLFERLNILYENIDGGNNSLNVINEARTILDLLLQQRCLTKKQHKELYSLFN